MAKNQRFLIFVIIGVFMVSIFGSAIFLIAGSDSTSDEDAAAEISDKLKQLQEDAATDDAKNDATTACDPGEVPQDGDGPKLPKYELPKGDVTKLVKKDLVTGKGTVAKAGDCIIAYYHGTLTDGTVFDSAYERGEPYRFSLLGVIEGWGEGIPGMREGGTRVLTIPSDLAYGETGSAPIIGPNEDLVFVVELVEVVE